MLFASRTKSLKRVSGRKLTNTCTWSANVAEAITSMPVRFPALESIDGSVEAIRASIQPTRFHVCQTM